MKDGTVTDIQYFSDTLTFSPGPPSYSTLSYWTRSKYLCNTVHVIKYYTCNLAHIRKIERGLTLGSD